MYVSKRRGREVARSRGLVNAWHEEFAPGSFAIVYHRENKYIIGCRETDCGDYLYRKRKAALGNRAGKGEETSHMYA